MKKLLKENLPLLFIAVLGASLWLTVAFTPTPRQMIIKRTHCFSDADLEEFIRRKTKEGYRVTQLESYDKGQKFFLIMEK